MHQKQPEGDGFAATYIIHWGKLHVLRLMALLQGRLTVQVAIAPYYSPSADFSKKHSPHNNVTVVSVPGRLSLAAALLSGVYAVAGIFRGHKLRGLIPDKVSRRLQP